MAKSDTKQRKQRAAVFKAPGHPARLQMVEILRAGERCVCDLVDVSEGGWSTVSRYLSVLKSDGGRLTS